MKLARAIAIVLSVASVTGCSHLPFGGDDVQQKRVASESGLEVRHSERGNMESYVVSGRRYRTLKASDGYSARGVASWYGPNFHGRATSSGEVYDMYRLTAAHRALPLPTYARVTHLENGKSVIVKINDRGPFSGDRILDLSFAAALKLGMVNEGTAMVDIQALSVDELLALSGPDNSMEIDFYDPRETELAKAGELLEIEDDVETSAAVSSDDPVNAEVLASNAGEIDPGLVTVAAVFNEDESKPQTTLPVAPIEVEPGILKLSDIDSDPNLARPPEVSSQQAQNPVAVSLQQAQQVKEDAAMVVAAVDTDTPEKAAQGNAVDVGSIVELPADSKKNSDNLEAETVYYIQAGVFPSEDAAERAAVDVVLEVPNETVTIKPLKDSEHFRVTVGPVLQSEHAKKVSAALHEAGVDNFTVKVVE